MSPTEFHREVLWTTEQQRPRLLGRLVRIGLALAIAGVVALLAIGPRVISCFCGSKTDLARIEASRLVYDAYPMWTTAQPDATGPTGCPTWADLSEYMDKRSSRDPWGTDFRVFCDPVHRRLAVWSFGPDREQATADDIWVAQ
ncbi:MAG: type II secretion system protein GspG [Kofleriaceae bacterium]